MLALVRRRRPPGEMTSPRPLVPMKDVRCVEPPRGADTVALLKEIMAADIAFSDSAATNVAAAFGGFAADDAAKPGKESAFVFGKAAITAAVRSASAEWSQVGARGRRGGAQWRFRFHGGLRQRARRRSERRPEIRRRPATTSQSGVAMRTVGGGGSSIETHPRANERESARLASVLNMKTLGIVGGIAPASTIEYYKYLIDAYRRNRLAASTRPL